MDELALIKAALASKDPDLWVAAHKLVSSPYYQFRPRPDRPDLLDEQSSFVEDKFDGIATILGGNRCLAGEQEIFDPVAGVYRRIDRIKTDFYVWSRGESGRRVIARSTAPFAKGVDDLYEVTLSNGQSFRCTLGHRVLTPAGFCDVRRLSVGDLLVSSSDTSLSGSQPGGRRCSGITSGCRCCCSPGRRRCGGPPLPPAGDAPSVAPSPAGAPGRTPICWHTGDPACGAECTPFCPRPGRRSRSRVSPGTTRRFFASGTPTPSALCSRSCHRVCTSCPSVPASTTPTEVNTAPPPPRPRSCPKCTCRSSAQWGRGYPAWEPGCPPVGMPWSRPSSEACTPGPGAPASVAASPDLTARPQSGHESCRTSPSRSFRGGETCTAPVGSGTPRQPCASGIPTPSTGCSRFYLWESIPGPGAPASVAASPDLTARPPPCLRSCPKCTCRSSGRGAKGRVFSCVSITSIRRLRKDVFYDITVPPHANYEVAGVWHHNSGKSVSSAYKVAKFIRTTPPPDKTTRFWCLSQTMEMSCGIQYAQHLESFLPEAEVVGWYSEKKGYPSSIVYRHPNGHRWMIEFRSYDMGRAALQGAAIGGFWCDEQIEHALLSEIVARTSNYRFPGSKIYSLTPLRPDYDLERIYAEQERHPGWKFYRLNTICNTKVDTSFLQHELDELRETRTTGVFASYSGSVYRTFSTATHVVDPPEIPRGWRHVAGIDFGWSHPTAAVFAARDLGGRYWVYQEYLKAQNSIEDHVRVIKEMWSPGPDHGAIWADYAAAQDRNEYAVRGLPTKAAHKDVKFGIAKVQELLRPGADGRPRLFISRKCENLIRQMRTYQWAENGTDKVLKKDDDLCDSLRMLIASEAHQMKPIDGLKLDTNRYFKRTLRATR